MDNQNERPPPVIEHEGRAQTELAVGNCIPIPQLENDRQEEGWFEQTSVHMLIGSSYIGAWVHQRRIHPATHVFEYYCRAQRDTDAALSAAAYKAFAAIGRLARERNRHALVRIHPAHFTPAGAASKTGCEFACALDRHGIELADFIEPKPDTLVWLDTHAWVDRLSNRDRRRKR
jgi:hypothetical protein